MKKKNISERPLRHREPIHHGAGAQKPALILTSTLARYMCSLKMHNVQHFFHNRKKRKEEKKQVTEKKETDKIYDVLIK